MSELRNSDFAKKHLRDAEEEKNPGRWCADCWLLHAYCICEDLRALHPPLSLGTHRLVVYMHYKEYRRSSNSAVLLQRMMEGHTKTIIYGTEEGESEFQREIGDEKYRNCALFPSDNATPISEWAAQHPGIPIRLIALDGTWKQCKKMSKSLPKSIPLVRLDPDTPSRFRSRKQTAGNRRNGQADVCLRPKRPCRHGSEAPTSAIELTPATEVRSYVVRRETHLRTSPGWTSGRLQSQRQSTFPRSIPQQ